MAYCILVGGLSFSKSEGFLDMDIALCVYIANKNQCIFFKHLLYSIHLKIDKFCPEKSTFYWKCQRKVFSEKRINLFNL